MTVAPAGQHAGVLGALGASETGWYAYFAANGVLSGAEKNANGEQAQQDAKGERYLYVWHEGKIGFIAVLEE